MIAEDSRNRGGDDGEAIRRYKQEAQDAARDEDGPQPAESMDGEGESDYGSPSSSFLPGVGDRVGPYPLLKELGRGGFGVVYMAERRAPYRQIVALKLAIPKPDCDPKVFKGILARFKVERQAMAMLNHGSIAKVYDAGEHAGLPYFVMEYVPGEPMATYCRTHKLTTNQRLELFAQVCDAIQHAHQNTIIHRDITPNNVLVMNDRDKIFQTERLVVKVVDFGIAKATSGRLTEGTLKTAEGWGTLGYMSPEQRKHQPDIDSRSDVFSLGALLYKLLTDTGPFDGQEFDVDPPSPSSRLTGLGDKASTIAADQKTSIAALVKRLQSELEWIPNKALREDRNRRYQTADALANDVRRYLNGLAIEAAPESRWYELKKTAWKYRGLVVSLAVVVMALTLGIAGTAYQGLLKSRATTQAVANKEIAEQKTKEATTQAALAIEQQHRARTSLANLFIDEGWREFDNENHSLALLLFAEAAKNNPTSNNRFRFDRLFSSVPRLCDARSSTYAESSAAASSAIVDYLGNRVKIRRTAVDPLLTFEHSAPICHATFSSDGSKVLTTSYDGTAVIWDANTTTREPLQTFNHGGIVLYAAFSPDDSKVVTTGNDRTAAVWSVANGTQLIPTRLEHRDAVLYAAFSPDGSRLVTASSNGTADLYVLTNGEPTLLKSLKHKGIVYFATFNPAGSKVVTTSEGGTAQVWDASTGNHLVDLKGHLKNRSVVFASFSPDGAKIVTACNDHTARVWDSITGKQLAVLPHDSLVGCAAFNCDGSKIVTASWDKTARVWEAVTGTAISPPIVHDGNVLKAYFSPNGLQIVTASSSGSARIWDVFNGKPLSPPLRHRAVVQSAEFSPDGSSVLTASDDKTAQLWPISMSRLSDDDATAFAELLSAHRVDATGAFVRLSAEEWQQRLSELIEHHPEHFSVPSVPSAAVSPVQPSKQ